MTGIGGPGGIGGPKGPSGPTGPDGPDDIDDVGDVAGVDAAQATKAATGLEAMAADIAAGKLSVRQIDLATLRVPVKRLTKVFAFDVNLFWVRDCADEVALLHERVLPGGSVNLFFDTSRPDDVPEILKNTSEALTKGGFRVYIVDSKQPPVIGIIGRR